MNTCKYCKKEHNLEWGCREYVDSVTAPQTWEERLSNFVYINEMYIRCFPVNKLKAFIASEIKTAQEEVVREIVALGEVHGGSRDAIWLEKILFLSNNLGFNISDKKE